jgi:hypothetical protein
MPFDTESYNAVIMMSLILDLFLELANRLSKRVVQSFDKLSTPVRYALLGISLLMLLGIFYPQPFVLATANARRLVMATEHAKSIPLRGTDRDKLDSLIRQIGDFVYSAYSREFEVQNSPGKFVWAWDAAQMAVALEGINLPERRPISRSKLLAFIARTRDPKCFCWEERPNEGDTRAHLGATAWVLFAKARLGSPAEPQELQFILASQNAHEGSWPMFPCTETYSGSTYATSWCIIALREQARRGLVREPWLTAVNTAVQAGASWLEAHRIPQGLWTSYPSIPSLSDTSISNSGLAVHALHAGSASHREAEKTWMMLLTPEFVPGFQSEAYNSWYCQQQNFQREDVRYFILPWKLVATVDAYQQGTLFERARAIKAIEVIMDHGDDFLRSIKGEYFIGAENLIALRHLREGLLAGEEKPSR